MLSSKFIGQAGAFLLAFIVFGYPIQAFLPFILGIDSNPINVGFRMVTLGLAIYLIFITSLKSEQGSRRISKGWLFFLLFWLIYSVRLIYDIEVKGLRYLTTEPFFVYSFAFGVCLFPTIAVYKSLPYSDLFKTQNLIFGTVLLSNLCLFYAIMSVGHWDLVQLALARATVHVEVDGVSTSIVNPITIGSFGQVLALIAIYLYNFSSKSSKTFRLFLASCMCLGLLNLILGASRGPMLFFLVLLIFEIYLITKRKKVLGVFMLKLGVATFIFGSYLTTIILAKIDSGEIEMINRVFGMVESRQNDAKEERDFEWAAAWQQFVDHPILGDAFVNNYDASYSHNLFLDVLMSTGLVGACVFFALLFFIFKAVFRSIKVIRYQPIFSFFGLIFLSAFLSSMTSGGLFMSAPVWMLSALVLTLKPQNANRQY